MQRDLELSHLAPRRLDAAAALDEARVVAVDLERGRHAVVGEREVTDDPAQGLADRGADAGVVVEEADRAERDALRGVEAEARVAGARRRLLEGAEGDRRRDADVDVVEAARREADAREQRRAVGADLSERAREGAKREDGDGALLGHAPPILHGRAA